MSGDKNGSAALVVRVEKTAIQPKYTDEDRKRVMDTVVEGIAKGLFQGDAFKRAGINVTTGRHWLMKGRLGGYPEFTEFARRYDEAETNMEMRTLGKIRDSEDPKSQQWILERRYPSKWGLKIQLEMRSQFESKLDIIRASLPPEKYGDAYEVVLAILAGDPTDNSDAAELPALNVAAE